MGVQMRAHVLAVVVLAILSGCEGDGASDAGTPDGSRPDGSTDVCARDGDCGEQDLFCSRWRCEPGTAGADARGCIDLGAPCVPGQECDEPTDMCGAPAWCIDGREGCATPGDCDGDGEDAIECGGADCDDADADRFPGNAEVCDASHDEDCSDSTVAGTDGDGDSDEYISSACCNGATCGPDCDDTAADVRPEVLELCNAIDDDCDGVTDDAESVLCPGGVCVAGRCDLDAWSRTFGGTNVDFATEVAQDAAGNVYMTGSFRGSITVGDDDYTAMANTDGLLVKFSPTGAIEWSRTFGTAEFDSASDVVATSDGRVFVTGSIGSGFDFGGGVRTFADTTRQFVLAVDAEDGAYIWDVVEFRGRAHVTASSSGDALVVCDVSAEATIAGMTRAAGDYVFVFSGSDGSYSDDWTLGVPTIPGGRITPQDIVSSADRTIVVGEMFGPVDFGGGPEGGSGGNYFIAAFDPTGATDWVLASNQPAPGGRYADAVEISASGDVYVAGHYGGVGTTIDFAPGVTEAAEAIFDGYLLALEADGTYRWHSTFSGTDASGDASSAIPHALALTTAGEPVVAGTFYGTINFGGGPLTAGTDPNDTLGFVVWVTADGDYASDVPTSGSGLSEILGLSVGPADSTVIVGVFTDNFDFAEARRASNGMRDMFVARFGS
jgi:hypothetical protein